MASAVLHTINTQIARKAISSLTIGLQRQKAADQKQDYGSNEEPSLLSQC
jgi:hypothetical protein